MYAKTMIKTSLSTAERTTTAMYTENTPAQLKNYQQKWVEKMDFLQKVSPENNAVIALFDCSEYRFVYMNDRSNVLGGYKPELFTAENGMDFNFSNVHPDQRSAAIQIQLKIFSASMEHAVTDKNNMVACSTFQYKRKTGEYIQYLQKALVVETDDLGNPLLMLRYGYDISHLVKPSVGLIINSLEGALIWTFNNSTKSLDKINLLSVQEQKVLKLLSEGRESKEIADMLFISHHTIDTHRRNLLKKTYCHDTTALITFGKMTGLIP